MPPKQRITREMILDKSFAMFMNEGMEAVNARSIAKALNCSTQPIFSYFAGMEELKSALDQRARDSFAETIERREESDSAIEDLCNAYVRFAGEQPRLFAHLFMQNGSTLGDVLSSPELKETLAEQESRSAGISDKQAMELCESVWVHAHGLAAARAVGLVRMSDKCVSDSLAKLRQGEVLRFKQSAAS